MSNEPKIRNILLQDAVIFLIGNCIGIEETGKDTRDTIKINNFEITSPDGY